jgi:acyl carrier protein/NADP-dependent 3-hydroxy acid dehydrogenase YdfG
LAAMSPSARLWIVTEKTQPVGGVGVSAPSAPLWGLARVIALENPERFGGIIDLESTTTSDDKADIILAELQRDNDDDQSAYRDGRRYVPRLARTEAQPREQAVWAADATYLITGGLGGLALKLAGWMVDRGVRYVALLGRSEFPARERWNEFTTDSQTGRRIAALRQLEAAGATVRVLRADVASRNELRDALSLLATTMPAIRGVFHTAADLDVAPLAEMTAERFARMFAPKIRGTVLLHELTAHLRLDHFVLYSSTTALWGSAGMAHYAAANQFLDAFAHYRHGLGLPALSVNWGTWDEMRLASADDQRRYAEGGLIPMASRQALTVLEAIPPSLPQVAVAAVEWSALRSLYEARRRRPFFSKLETGPDTTAETPSKVNLADELQSVPVYARKEALTAHVMAHVARILGVESDTVLDADRGLFEMGMDSLMSVELKSSLERACGQRLPSTLTFNYPTIRALSQFLWDEIVVSGHEPAQSTDAVSTPAAAAGDDTDDLDDLSEDELEAMLASRLGGT